MGDNETFKTKKKMKKFLTLLMLFVGLSIASYGQVKRPTTTTKNKTTVKVDEIQVDTIGEGRDPDVFVYKCIDSKTKETVYVDLLDIGYLGFFTNKTLVRYKIQMYALTAKDTAWEYDYVSIILQNKMPIEAVQFNPDETKITVYVTGKDGSLAIADLLIIKKLSGFSEFIYVRKKNKYATFTYGDDKIPTYIKYENKK